MPPSNLARYRFGWADLRAPSLLQRAFRAWLTERERRRAIHELRALSDRALADIGIDRSEIESLVTAAARDRSRHRR
jgi:uncharacterized protein YjiS (DUF1127 family)